MASKKFDVLVTSGFVSAAIGAAGVILFLLQPWRSCPGEDSPTACAMIPSDIIGLSIAGAMLVVGILIIWLGILFQNARSQS